MTAQKLRLCGVPLLRWVELPLDGARTGGEILEGLIGVEEGCGDGCGVLSFAFGCGE
jgi:hypothetical protein